MQGRAIWSPPEGTLGRLCARARERAQRVEEHAILWKQQAASLAPAPSLLASLRRGSDVAVIAELKRRSPSKGSIDLTLDARERTRAYALGGARALSILTEPTEFGGSISDVVAARTAVELPLLRKDFLVAPAQVWEARVAGASAVLLIVRALGPEGTARLADVAREARIETLVEVRDEQELTWALDAGATIIGVNRRNLETLEMEPGVIERVFPLIPADRCAVAESGVRDRAGVAAVASLGADAVLVGSSLSSATDGTSAVRALTGVARRSRAA